MATKRKAASKRAGAAGKKSPSNAFWQPSKDLKTLAAEQGVKPVADPDELLGDFWPEEERLDEFLTWLRELRQEGREES